MSGDGVSAGAQHDIGPTGLQDLYRDLILDHSRHPHGKGLHDDALAQSRQVNPTCGDEVTLQLLPGSSGSIGAIAWEGHGCSISQSSASILASVVADDTPERLAERIESFRAMMHSRGQLAGDEELLGDAIVFQGASRYVARVKCAMLPWVAAEAALARLA